MSETEGLRKSVRDAIEKAISTTPVKNRQESAAMLHLLVNTHMVDDAADAVLALPQVAELQGKVAEQSGTIATLRDGYREAVGVPPSEHQSRRLEQMATRIESDAVVIADLRRRAEAAEGKVERARWLLDKWQHTPNHYCCERCQLAAALASSPTTHESEGR